MDDPLYSLLMMISEYHNLNTDRNYGNAMANILFKNHCYLAQRGNQN